jgi:hypothetical protein
MNNKKFSPSWIDRLILWLEGRRLSPQAIYLALLFLFAILNNVAAQANPGFDGKGIDILETTDAFYLVIPLAFYHYLKNSSAKTFDHFSENFKGTKARLEADKYEFSNSRAWQGYFALGLGVFAIINDAMANPEANGIFVGASPIIVFYRVFPRIIAFSFLIALVIYIFRQLRLIQKFHRTAENLSIFRLHTAHAFSDQTAAIGIFLITFLLFRFVQDGGIANDELIGYFVGLALAISAFVGPLLSLRGKLAELKQAKLNEYFTQLEEVFQESSDVLRNGNYKVISENNAAIVNLKSKLDHVKSISSLPWNTTALVNFVGSVLLPILIWLITRFLDNIL